MFVCFVYVFNKFNASLHTKQRWAESQKTDFGSAPVPKTWTPVCRQILESESAPDPDFSLNPKPKYYVSIMLSNREM